MLNKNSLAIRVRGQSEAIMVISNQKLLISSKAKKSKNPFT